MQYLPERIKKYLSGQRYETDKTGMSGAEIRLYPESVLKISRDDGESRREAGVMEWLRGKLPVPEVLACERENGFQYLLMTRLEGVMLCDKSLMAAPDTVARLLACSIGLLSEVPPASCPFTCTIEEKLAMARGHVERGEVDVQNTEPATFGPGGFRDPEHLLRWLEDNRPEEKLTFTHGDLCLPNVFTINGEISGFLDLGKSGLADIYTDLAIAYRSLMHNTDGSYGPARPDFDPDVLFDHLAITPDREKLRYYLLLDELF